MRVVAHQSLEPVYYLVSDVPPEKVSQGKVEFSRN